MLERITEVPTDKRIAGVHVIPLADDGSIVMGWNREAGLLENLHGLVCRSGRGVRAGPFRV
jgi:8-oxo-dGTP diphosphatase